MADGLPRFQRGVGAAPGGAAINPAAGAGEHLLVRTFNEFAANQARNVAIAGAEVASNEGLARGLEEENIPQASNVTLAGQAFNRAARVGHVVNIRADIKTRLAEQQLEAQTLPPEQWVDAFVAKSEGLRDGLLAEVDPSVRGDVLAYFNDTAGNARLKLLEGQQNALRTDTAKDLANGREDLLDDITTAARENNEDLLTVRQREYEAAVLGAVDMGLMLPSDGDAMVKDMHSVALMSQALGTFETVVEQDVMLAEENLAKFKRKKASALDLSVAEKDQLETSMTGILNRELAIQGRAAARDRANRTAANVGLTRQANDTIKMLESGFPVDVAELAGELVASEKFDKLAELASALDTQGKLSQFQTLPWAKQRELLTDMRQELTSGKASPDDLSFMLAAERSASRTETMLANDPLTLAIEHGIAEDLPPLVTDTLETIARSLENRLPIAEAAGVHYQQRVPVVTEAEAATIGAFYEQASIEEKLALSASFVEGLGPQAGDLLQMLDKKGHRMAGYTGGLVLEGQKDTAAAILRGQQAIAASDEIMPTGTEKNMMDEHVQARLRESFEALPSQRATTVDAIGAWYADRAVVEGDFSGSFNPRRADMAIGAVVGNVVTDFTGAAVPVRNASQGVFDRWQRAITAEQVAEAGGVSGFSDKEAAEQLRRSRVIAVGPGEFRFGQPSPFTGQPQFFVTDTGQPFQLLLDPASVPAPLNPLDRPGMAAGIADQALQ